MTGGNLLLQLLCKRTGAPLGLGRSPGLPARVFLTGMEKTPGPALINLNKFAGFRVIYGHLSLTPNTLFPGRVTSLLDDCLFVMLVRSEDGPCRHDCQILRIRTTEINLFLTGRKGDKSFNCFIKRMRLKTFICC